MQIANGTLAIPARLPASALEVVVAEFDFRHSTRAMSDAERGDELLKGAKGKSLTYHQPRETANA